MNCVMFQNFGDYQTGTIVTHHGDVTVVFARNPYGKHNLVLIDRGVAVRHGNDAAIACAQMFGLPQKQVRRAMTFLAMRNKKRAN